jgi:hypothetical protein
MMNENAEWSLIDLLDHWGLINSSNGIHGEGKRMRVQGSGAGSGGGRRISVPSPAFSHLISSGRGSMMDDSARDVREESVLFGAFRASAVVECMKGTTIGEKELEVLVRDVRAMVVEWAHDMWSHAVADDDIRSHLAPT